MGSEAGRPDERPEHEVRVRAFRAGLRPVSNAQYAAFVADTGHEAPPFLDDPRFVAEDQPVVGVSWHDAIAYCRWLSVMTDERFRLPTEAEREYAARGGLEGVDWPWGGASPAERSELALVAALEQPHAPSLACANGYGLLCTADNVHEWCSDWYAPAYYERSPAETPRGPRSGTRRSSRGGSWRHQVKFTRLSARSSLDPTSKYNDYGFRAYADANGRGEG